MVMSSPSQTIKIDYEITKQQDSHVSLIMKYSILHGVMTPAGQQADFYFRGL